MIHVIIYGSIHISQIEDTVRRCLKKSDLPSIFDLVTASVPGKCTDMNDISQPFVQITSTDPNHFAPLIRLFNGLGMGVEVPQAFAFYQGDRTIPKDLEADLKSCWMKSHAWVTAAA